jgi:Tol biopolymer transport system component
VLDGGFENPVDMSGDGRFTVGWERESLNSGLGTGYGIVLRNLQTGVTRRLGAARDARISRDGQRVALACNDQGKRWFCIVGTESGVAPQPIIELSSGYNVLPVDWSYDGKALLVLVQRSSAPSPSVELAWLTLESKSIRTIKVFEPWEALGGRLLGSRVSPDGQFVAFVMRPQPGQEHSVHIIDVNGHNESRIVRSAGPNDYPVWTPDGGHLLFVGEVGGLTGLFSVRINGGRAAGEPILEQRDSGFLGAGDRNSGGNSFYLYPLRVTSSGALYYTRTAGNVNYEFVANRTPSNGDTAQAFSGIHGAWSPQGQLAFLRETGGDDSDLIIRDMTSGEEKRYLRPGMDFRRDLRWLPDGSGVIVFVNETGDVVPDAVYKLETSTGAFRRLFDVQTGGRFLGTAVPSADSKTLYFTVSETALSPANRIVAVDIETAIERTVLSFKPETLESRGAAYAAAMDLSPNGQRLAVSVPATPTAVRIFTIGVDGTGYRDVVASFPTGWNNLRWTPDGQSLVFVGSNPDTSWRIMRVPASGGQPVFDGLDEHQLQAMLPDIKLFPSNLNGFDFSP